MLALFVAIVAAATINAVPAGMVLIASGEYVPLYGEKKAPVSVKPFFLDKRAVTNGEYLDFVRTDAKWQRDGIAELFAEKAYLEHWESNLKLRALAPSQSPVTNVSWFAVRAYCKAQHKRLPTLDEWEYAAQAGIAASAARDSLTQLILNWYGTPTRLPLASVGRTYNNGQGLWDMHGLIWEWVDDFNAVLLTGESRKDASLDRNLFCAAGSLGSVDPNDYATFMRYATRASVKANHALKNLGFRCARGVRP